MRVCMKYIFIFFREIDFSLRENISIKNKIYI